MKKTGASTPKKHPGAVALGKIRAAQMTFEERSAAGKVGGATRAENLSKKRLSEIGKKAAAARWAKQQAKKAAE